MIDLSIRSVFLPVFFSFLLIGYFLSMMAAAQKQLSLSIQDIQSNLKVHLYLQDALSDTECLQFAKKLSDSDPSLRALSYKSRQQAYEEESKNPYAMKALQILKRNPYPASYEFELQTPTWVNRSDPLENVKKNQGIQALYWDVRAVSTIKILSQWTERIRQSLVAMNIIGLVIIVLAVFRLLSHRIPFAQLVKWVALLMVALTFGMGIAYFFKMGELIWPFWECGALFSFIGAWI